MMNRQYYVYILAHEPHGAVYIGVTNDLVRRVYEHRVGLADGSTKKYHIKTLVYYEVTGNIEAAISREKLLKRWKRSWKEEMINAFNPEWRDLYTEICGLVDPASTLRSVRDDMGCI